MKSALIAVAQDDNNRTMAEIEHHYLKLCRYIHFENKGMLSGKRLQYQFTKSSRFHNPHRKLHTEILIVFPMEQSGRDVYTLPRMRGSRNYDLGKDGLWYLVLSLAIPTALGQAVNVLYAIVDRMYIGHIAGYGDIALAGVGVASPIAAFLSSFASLIGMGGSPIMAMREGHGEHEEAQKVLTTGFYLLIAASVVLTPLFFIFRDPILLTFGASGVTLPYASDYLGIYILGTPFALLSTGLNSFVINQGLSKKGMLSVLVGAIMNIILDPLFIFTFDMGVKGAAIATVISQMASMLISIMALRGRNTQIKLRFHGFVPNQIPHIIKFGLSSFIILSTDSLLLVVLNAMLQYYGGPGFGDILITCSTIVQSYHILVTYPMNGMTAGCQGLVSYNYGAGFTERVRKSINNLQILITSYTIVMFVFTIFGSGLFASLFTSDPEILRLSAKYMFIFECMIIPLSFQYVNVDMMTALGQIHISLPLSLTRKILFFLASLILPMLFGASAAFFSEPISDLVSCVVGTIILRTQLGKILERRIKEGFRI